MKERIYSASCRMKTAHRRLRKQGCKLSLKGFARAAMMSNTERAPDARLWFARKAGRAV